MEIRDPVTGTFSDLTETDAISRLVTTAMQHARSPKNAIVFSPRKRLLTLTNDILTSRITALKTIAPGCSSEYYYVCATEDINAFDKFRELYKRIERLFTKKLQPRDLEAATIGVIRRFSASHNLKIVVPE